MSPWLSHALMHQKGLKKAQLVACLHCNYVAGILCFRVSLPSSGGQEGICFPWCGLWKPFLSLGSWRLATGRRGDVGKVYWGPFEHCGLSSAGCAMPTCPG